MQKYGTYIGEKTISHSDVQRRCAELAGRPRPNRFWFKKGTESCSVPEKAVALLGDSESDIVVWLDAAGQPIWLCGIYQMLGGRGFQHKFQVEMDRLRLEVTPNGHPTAVYQVSWGKFGAIAPSSTEQMFGRAS